MEAKTMTAKLWDMANKLRGTMDASEYKNYILPFMFYKYLSEYQNEYLEKNGLQEYYDVKDEGVLDEYLSDIVQSLGYVIRPEFIWSEIVSKINNHKIKASDFQDLFDNFDLNVKRNAVSSEDFINIFADVNLGDTRLGHSTNERAQALYEIVLIVDEIVFKDDSGKDVIGDVYEYLIGQFAANAGKKGGEFYTPHAVSRVLARLVTKDIVPNGSQFRVYDPTMGSGSLLLTVQKELPGGEQNGAVDFYGQELNTTTYNLARMNLMMHGVNYRNLTLKCANTLNTDWPFSKNREGIELPLKFDAVVANPPYSQNWDASNEKDPRFKAGLAPKSKADYAFIQHCLYHLDKKGTMAIVLPHGVLFRGASEGKIRQALIQDNMLDAVIGLPANLFYGTSIPTVILVFKGSEIRTNKDILFIDASNKFDKAKNQNSLSDEHIDEILNVYSKRENVDKYAYVANLDEIKSNDYNLNIPRYVDTFEEEEVVSLSELIEDIIDTRKKIAESNKEFCELLDELVGTTDEAEKELRNFVKQFKEVNSHE